MKAYGKPSAIDRIYSRDARLIIPGDSRPNVAHPELGQTLWRYSGADDDLRTASFGIRDGKVAWIFLSHDE